MTTLEENCSHKLVAQLMILRAKGKVQSYACFNDALQSFLASSNTNLTLIHTIDLDELMIKIPKNIAKSILQIIWSCSRQKTASKSTKYSRNETILKITHNAKSIALAKSSPWVKKLNSKKKCQNAFFKSFRVFLCKIPLQKTLNIREMRPFQKSPIMQRL